MTNIVKLNAPSRLPNDFPSILRDLADKAERGEIIAFAAAYADHDAYHYVKPSSHIDTIALAALLSDNAIKSVHG